MSESKKRVQRQRRHARVRFKVDGNGNKPRLCVFRSSSNIYVQVIDDTRGHTLAAASSLDPEIKEGLAGKPKTAQAGQVGSLVAERALAEGITQVMFDRGGFKYHGRVKALADAAREKGLKF